MVSSCSIYEISSRFNHESQKCFSCFCLLFQCHDGTPRFLDLETKMSRRSVDQADDLTAFIAVCITAIVLSVIIFAAAIVVRSRQNNREWTRLHPEARLESASAGQKHTNETSALMHRGSENLRESEALVNPRTTGLRVERSMKKCPSAFDDELALGDQFLEVDSDAITEASEDWGHEHAE